MYFSVWTFIVYVPLFLAAFVLGIAALAQRRIVTGVLLLLVTLILPPVQWFALSSARLNKFVVDHPVPGLTLIGQTPAPVQTPAVIRDKEPTASTIVPTQSGGANVNNPDSAQASIVDGILKQPVSDAHAWQIKLAYSKPLADYVPLLPQPLFSTDSRSVMYPQIQEGRLTLVIASLRDHTTQFTWNPSATPTSIGWSQDEKQIAYKVGQVLHLMDTESRRDVVLPLTDYFGGDASPLAWINSNTLACVDPSREIYILHLDSLRVDATSFMNDDAGFRKHSDLLLRPGYENIHCEIETNNIDTYGSQNGPFLFASEKDGSYKSAIAGRFHADRFYVSPDIKHVIVLENGKLIHLYVGLRTPPEIYFAANLNAPQILTSDRQVDFRKFIANQIAFDGRIYAPLLNPLNNQVIGPDPNHLKGYFRFIKWKDEYAVGKVSVAFSSIQPGDIIANIVSDKGLEMGQPVFDFGKQWSVLQAPTDEDRTEGEQADQNRRKMFDDAPELIIGTWRDEDSVTTYYSDGTLKQISNNGSVYKADWVIESDVLTANVTESNGKAIAEAQPFISKIVSISDLG